MRPLRKINKWTKDHPFELLAFGFVTSYAGMIILIMVGIGVAAK